MKTTFKQNSGAFAPHGIAHNLPSRARCGRATEDAHEFLRYLLEHLTQVFLPLQKYPQDRGRYTFLQWWFQGTLQSQIQCTRCGGESNTLDAFLDLSLELAAAPNGTGGGGGGGVVPTVTRAMELFTQTETLDGANKYKCERCACLVPARKQFRLHSPRSICTTTSRASGTAAAAARPAASAAARSASTSRSKRSGT